MSFFRSDPRWGRAEHFELTLHINCSLFHLYLSHHAIVFMFKIMAMEHINALLLKLYSYFHRFIWFYGNSIFPAPFIFWWFFSIPGKYFILRSMNVEWMDHSP